MNTFIIISLLILVFYVFRIHKWHYHWQKADVYKRVGGFYLPVSVVIAFRNERENIENLLNSLKNQDYPSEYYEVILVDDYSDDDSVNRINEIIRSLSNFRCISNTGSGGKKSALETGIRKAKHGFIVTTDADAVVKSTWLSTIGSFSREYSPDLIIGIADIRSGSGFFSRFSEAEFISLVASGAGAAAAGNAVFCNGANLAFSKELFLSSSDPMKENVVSGDDTFMLHSAKRSAGGKIVLLKSPDSVVVVKGPFNLKQFINQHIRWVSKSKHYTDKETVKTALLVLLVNISIVASSLFALAGTNLWLFPVLLIVKAASDYRLLSDFYIFLGKSLKTGDYLLFSLIYPFLMMFTGFAGLVSGYNWKGRYYKAGS